MIFRNFLFIALLYFFFACSKDNSGSPFIPLDIRLDVNNDGINDLLFEFGKSQVNSAMASEALFCTMQSLEGTSFLVHQTEPPLFLNSTELIIKEVEEPLYWVPSPVLVSSREKNLDCEWNDQWRTYSRETRETYFIAFHLNVENQNPIGWIEFSIDQMSGEINIIDIQFVN